MTAAPIALALDAPDLDTACRWANAVNGVFSREGGIGDLFARRRFGRRRDPGSGS